MSERVINKIGNNQLEILPKQSDASDNEHIWYLNVLKERDDYRQ